MHRQGPRRPSIGLVLNQEEGPGVPTPRWTEMRDVARTAEAVGVDSLWLVDHFLWQGDPWGRDGAGSFGVWECWTTLAALAEATTRPRLGTLVTCTGYRNPALLAKMADTVDEISGGRLVLGLGAGDAEDEHEMFGFSFERRFARFEEALAIIGPLLHTGRVDFEGEFFSARAAELRPRGSRAAGPPILIGALRHRPRALRLVVQHADIWNSWITDRDPIEALPAVRAAVDEACVTYGRDPATLRRSLVVAIALEGPMTAREGPLKGTPDEIADSLMAIAGHGIDEIQAYLFPTNRESVAFLGRVIEELDGAVLSRP